MNHYPNAEAANKMRAAASALEAAERTTNPSTAVMWRQHASALMRQARRAVGEARC